MLRYKEQIKGLGKIIPKGITIDNQKQDIKTYETININKDSLDFQKHWQINFDYVDLSGQRVTSPKWVTTTRFKMAPAGAGGGGGGAASNNEAVSRIAVMDPHLLQMMRDVMDASDTAVRLNPQGQATGGGGGGGGSGTPDDSNAEGDSGVAGSTVSNCVVPTTQAEGGSGGTGGTAGSGEGGGGGGGAGGGGGVIVVCTTTAEGSFLSGKCSVAGGTEGSGGSSTGTGATDGQDGGTGVSGTKLWIQI
tara:strand:- start:502 stop:1248 length:747 start_codon:yes stop_codon:yes gene_type:complete